MNTATGPKPAERVPDTWRFPGATSPNLAELLGARESFRDQRKMWGAEEASNVGKREKELVKVGERDCCLLWASGILPLTNDPNDLILLPII